MTGVEWFVKKLYFEKEQCMNDKIFCIKKVSYFLGDLLFVYNISGVMPWLLDLHRLQPLRRDERALQFKSKGVVYSYSRRLWVIVRCFRVERVVFVNRFFNTRMIVNSKHQV